MYGISTYICHKNQLNTIHGSYGKHKFFREILASRLLTSGVARARVPSLCGPYVWSGGVFGSWKGWKKGVEKKMHPWKLTWNVNIAQFKSKIIFQAFIFRFYVNLQGCIWFKKVGKNFHGLPQTILNISKMIRWSFWVILRHIWVTIPSTICPSTFMNSCWLVRGSGKMAYQILGWFNPGVEVLQGALVLEHPTQSDRDEIQHLVKL